MTSKYQITTPQLDAALATAEKIRLLTECADKQFIDRAELTAVTQIALVAGEHLLLLAKPGTAKTSYVDYIAEGLGVRSFYASLNAETASDDLYGPINPLTIHTHWERVKAGIMTSPIVFLDEVGKAPAEVQHLLIPTMQERKLPVLDDRIDLPLHCLFGATNETITDNPAFFDRFALRCHLTYIKDVNLFLTMLTSIVDEPPTQYQCTLDELANMRRVCSAMATTPTQGALRVMGELFTSHPVKFQNEEPISDRRWKRTLPCAAAHALLRGETEINAVNLSVARFMYWSDHEQAKAVADWVLERTDKEIGIYREKLALVVEAEKMYTQIANTGSEKDKLELSYNVRKIVSAIRKYKSPQWYDLRNRAQELVTQLETVDDVFEKEDLAF